MAVLSGASNRQVTPTWGGTPVLTLQAGAIGKAQAPHRGQCRPSPQVRPDMSDFDAALDALRHAGRTRGG